MKQERRQPRDHDVVLQVVKYVGFSLIILSSSAAASLGFVVIYSVIAGKQIDASILPLLIAAVSNPMSAALGYLAGLLNNPRRDTPTPAGTPSDPITTESTVTTTPDKPLDVTVSDEPLPDSLTHPRDMPGAKFEPKDER